MGKLMALFAMLIGVQTFAAPKVLVVLSSENKITLKDGVVHPTGFFLSELAVPVQALIDAGYEPVFSTPKGNAPVIDKVSDSAMWFGGDQARYESAKNLVAGLAGLKSPRVLADIVGTEKDYEAIFVPGGHAPMEDLYRDESLGKILRAFHAAGKATALICHGPIALLSAHESDDWIYKDYKMTVFSTAEEKQEEPGEDNVLGGYVRFYPDQALEDAGGEVSVSGKWLSHVVQDRELITGQNPMSDVELAAVLVKALHQQGDREALKNQAQEIKERLLNEISSGSFTKLGGQFHLNELTAILNGTTGYSEFFIGWRQDRLSPEKFAQRLDQHVRFVSSQFSSRGLTGYFAFATKDYEIAIMTWASEEMMNRAFQEAGQPVTEDAAQFLDTLVFETL